jgi:hypothetical protein
VSDKGKDELYFRCFVVSLAVVVVLEVVAWYTGQQAPIEYLCRLIMRAMG